MKKNIIKEEHFISFLQKNKENDDFLKKNLTFFKSPFNNTNENGQNNNKTFEISRKQLLKEEILKNLRLEDYFLANKANDLLKNCRITLESKLDRIEKVLGFQIYRLIQDLNEYIKNSIQKDNKRPEITIETKKVLDFQAKNNKDLIFFTDKNKEEFFKSLHFSIQKAELKQSLNDLYDKSIAIYCEIPKNPMKTLKHFESFESFLLNPLEAPSKAHEILKSQLIYSSPEKSPLKREKPGVLIHSNSLTITPKKTSFNEDEKLTPRTPEKKNKKVSFHEEVTIQIFSPVDIKTNIVKTVKKEEYKERKKKGAISFMDFQKKIDENDSKRNEGTKNLLSFIKRNDLGRMENLNFLQNNLEGYKKNPEKTEKEEETQGKIEKIEKNEGKFNRENGRRSKLIRKFQVFKIYLVSFEEFLEQKVC